MQLLPMLDFSLRRHAVVVLNEFTHQSSPCSTQSILLYFMGVILFEQAELESRDKASMRGMESVALTVPSEVCRYEALSA